MAAVTGRFVGSTFTGVRSPCRCLRPRKPELSEIGHTMESPETSSFSRLSRSLLLRHCFDSYPHCSSKQSFAKFPTPFRLTALTSNAGRPLQKKVPGWGLENDRSSTRESSGLFHGTRKPTNGQVELSGYGCFRLSNSCWAFQIASGSMSA
jgi:hypothetical protein